MFITHARIADFNIEFRATYYQLSKICKPYEAIFDKPDICIVIDEQEVLEAYNNNLKNNPESTVGCGYYEGIIAFRKLNKIISKYDAFVFHGASFSANGNGLVFCALSGTGKTTHMLLWEKMLGNGFKIINGDKPIIRFIDNIPYIYGTPWNGKEHFGCNDKVRLNDICFIERSEKNEVLPISRTEATQRLSTQMVKPEDVSGVLKNMDFIEKLLISCRTWIIKCNMESEAAEVAYNSIYGKFGN